MKRTHYVRERIDTVVKSGVSDRKLKQCLNGEKARRLRTFDVSRRGNLIKHCRQDKQMEEPFLAYRLSFHPLYHLGPLFLLGVENRDLS